MNIKKIQKNTKSFTESSIKKLSNEKNVLPQIIQDEYNLNGKAKSSWIYPDTDMVAGTDQRRGPVLWGEVVGCLVLGLSPCCEITIQLTVFPEVAVMPSIKRGSAAEEPQHKGRRD